MNPPPRKVKPAVALKNIQTEQTSKLQAKHQQESDILEDIRTFFRQKAALEKEYAQGLLKVTGQLLKRDFPAQPDIASEDGHEHKTVVAVWRHLLDETDRQAKARLQAAEIYAERIAEPLKGVKAAKQQCTKKVMPQLGVLQGELSSTVMEMVKAHKAYVMEETTANDARQKVSEAEDKLKRKSTGLFQSMAGLQKTCQKLRSRKEMCEARSTAARNEYLLAMAGANAHQIRFYSTDLPDLMKTLDCDIYERIQEYLTMANSTAADISKVEANSFATIAEEAEKVCRQFSLQCYLFQNQVFTNLVQYNFDPCQHDKCNRVSGEHGAVPELEKEARKCAGRVAKETKLIRDYYRQLGQLQTRSQSRSTDRMSESSQEEKSDSKSNGASVDPEQRMEDIKQSIRKAETSKMKAEARLEALRVAGINVDEWLNQAQMDSLSVDENGLQRTPSQNSLRTDSSGGHSADDQEPTYTHYDDDDDDDFIDDTFISSYSGATSRFGRPFPIVCKALYDFEASNYDELSMKQNEPLTLVADGDGEGWVKATNSSGQTGYIPENYVDLSEMDATTPTEAEEEIVDSVTPDAAAQAENHAPPSPHTPTYNTSSVLTSSSELQLPADVPPDTTSPYSSCDLEVQQTTDDMVDGSFPPPPLVPGAGFTWARALYDYEAQTQEELSFLEGALIKILRKDDNGVDDGYWEGELNARRGVFPSLVVEEVLDVVEMPVDEEVQQPPVTDYVTPPPPVTVTMPTPDDEPPPPPPICQNGSDNTSQNSHEYASNEQLYDMSHYNNYKRVRFSNEQMQYAGMDHLSDEWDSEGGEESFV
ncbi:F-BAR and double SH3 domains protein 2-like isoform X2 [Babylonia areolata]|uniref:F-BAR and double SH3 domains protein 2-like isoform X2 n=1 Tax=Babylonia areolata TaxID=304850 RepID=UPI003FD61618